ncbi:MAG: serine/threonine protein kinase with repeat [Acidobacteria bacterium]|nr:serine/threonine protein kinase with repeat [Acidobacteriota bacterium]
MNKELETNTNLSHYRIRRKIGAGGMGEVYLAEDTRLDRQVAIKFLKEEFSRDADKLKRFIQEAKAASALNHPNILTVYEIGEVDGKNYIATEFIDGKTLREHLSANEAAMPLNQILKIGVQTSEALAAAHQAGINHRDIKPENIMIRADGYAKVLDFGLAKLTEKKKSQNISLEGDTKALVKTNPGMIMGTVLYMSPEQARGKETDARTDIWSLGIVLYEMLAGKVPFTGETINHTIVSILEKEPLLLESVPDELQRIVRKALTKDKEMRYQTARDLLIDLKNLRRNLDIQGELERSVVPNREINKTSAPEENETQVFAAKSSEERQGAEARATQNVMTASSLEYAVTQAKSHKFVTVITGFILLGTISAVAYFSFFAKSNTGQIDSIAVLPFQNRSADADTEYLSDGLGETLIYRLSQLPNLKVSPTSSVLRYKGRETDVQIISRELGVDAVMSGRIAQRGDNLTISVELVDARNDKVIWGEQYERKMSELLATQREIAATITQKLQLKLSGAEPGLTRKYTDNNEAYQLYIKARFHFAKRTKEDILKSIELFREAIKLDPNFALAFVGVAEAYANMPSYPYLSPKEAMSQAKPAIAEALRLDPALPEAYNVAGTIAATYDWEWAEAERCFKRSLELDPNLAVTHYRYGWIYLSPLGRHAEAIAEMKRAMELEPLSVIQGANYAAVLMYARQFDFALEQARKTYELDPNHIGARIWMSHTLNAKGMYAESILISEKSLQLGLSSSAQMGYAYAKSGQRLKAESLIAKFKEAEKTRYVSNYWGAILYAALGERDAAFANLEKAYHEKDWFLPRLKADPFMDSLRGDARFADLVKRLNLPE